MVIRCLFKEGIIVNNERLGIGVEIRNSEVGIYSTQVRIIVTACDFGSYLLTSTPVIRIRHAHNKSKVEDIANELEQLATTLRQGIFNKVQKLFLDDNLTPNSLDSFLISIKDVVTKDEYNDICKITIKNGKVHFLKGLYSVIYDADYVKLDKVESKVRDSVFSKFIV